MYLKLVGAKQSQKITRWWFQRFFIFIPTWGNDPIWLNGLKPPTRLSLCLFSCHFSPHVGIGKTCFSREPYQFLRICGSKLPKDMRVSIWWEKCWRVQPPGGSKARHGKEKSLIWLKDSTNNELQVTLWGKGFGEIGKTLNTGDVLQVDNAIMLKQKGQFSGSLCWAFLRQWKEPRLCHFAAIHETNRAWVCVSLKVQGFFFNKNPSNLYWWFLLGTWTQTKTSCYDWATMRVTGNQL